MFNDYSGLLGGLNANDIGNSFGLDPASLDLGGFNDLVNGDMAGAISLDGATDLYGTGLTGGIDFGASTFDSMKNVVPATSPVAGIPGVDNVDPLTAGLDDGGRMQELIGVENAMNNMAPADPSLTTYGSLGGNPTDMWGTMARASKGLGGLMGLYSAWQKMNIMNKNEARNQKGFDLANERYDRNHANVRNAFAV